MITYNTHVYFEGYMSFQCLVSEISCILLFSQWTFTKSFRPNFVKIAYNMWILSRFKCKSMEDVYCNYIYIAYIPTSFMSIGSGAKSKSNHNFSKDQKGSFVHSLHPIPHKHLSWKMGRIGIFLTEYNSLTYYVASG